jgi:hypothetical protein
MKPLLRETPRETALIAEKRLGHMKRGGSVSEPADAVDRHLKCVTGPVHG